VDTIPVLVEVVVLDVVGASPPVPPLEIELVVIWLALEVVVPPPPEGSGSVNV
jgi:hypothetical protein